MMEKPGEMTTLTSVLKKLHDKGLDHELKLSDHGRMQNVDKQKIYNPDELKIIKTYRFEGESDPADMSVLYLLEDKDGEIGYILDAYGTYSTHEEAGFDEFLQKIPVDEREDQLIFGLSIL